MSMKNMDTNMIERQLDAKAFELAKISNIKFLIANNEARQKKLQEIKSLLDEVNKTAKFGKNDADWQTGWLCGIEYVLKNLVGDSQ